jgi:hydrogenase maturation protein HypF
MCDAILWHARPIERPVDDSVLLDAGDRRGPVVLRRSRGYVPTPILLPDGLKSQGLCVGGEMKNTVAVVRENEVTLSQHLGDLAHARTYASFKRAIDDLLRLFAVKPQWVAHDLHPTYVSTMYAAQLARELHVPRVRFQHHYAHAAAVLAEHGQMGPALAVVCDGTGYGTDHTIWGGELLSVDFTGFRRIAHLRPIRLPGGDAAAKQPWRSAMALLLNAFGEQFIDHPIVAQLVADAGQAQFVAEMLRTRTNCVSSSSAGRLFDGVAALLGLCRENAFEAQAPLALESAAHEFGDVPAPPRPLFELQQPGVIELSPLVRDLVERRLRGAPVEELAAGFHEQFVAAWEAAVLRAAEQTGLIEVVLSGGVLCNEIVDRQLTERLERRGLHVLRHRLVPPNDGGLALGQAALASYWAANGLIEK